MQGSDAGEQQRQREGKWEGRGQRSTGLATLDNPHTPRRVWGVRQDSYFLKSRSTDADNGVLGKPGETSKLRRLRWAASMCCRRGRLRQAGRELHRPGP